MTTDLKNREWRPVRGFEALYLVSSLGEVYSTRRGKLKSLALHPKTGYLMVILSAGVNKYPHRLVCEAFHSDSEFDGAQVNHKDGIKTNNHFENLEWVTRSRNIIHGFENGLIKSNLTGKFGCLNSKARPVVAIKEMAIVEFGSIIECARYVGGKYNNIRSNFLNKKPFNGFQIYSL
jgi:hypothetical protein